MPDMPEMSEEERKKMELENDEVFMKYVKIYKITKNLGVIKQKMRQEGNYEPKLIDVSPQLMMTLADVCRAPRCQGHCLVQLSGSIRY